MNSKKMYFILLGLIIGITAAGSFGAYTGNALLQKKSDELAGLKLEQYSNQIDQNIALRANEKVEEYKDVIELVQTVIPQDKDQAQTIAEILQIANEAGVSLNGFTFTGSSLDAAQPKKLKEGTPKPISQLTPVTGLGGIYAMEVNTSSSSSVEFSNFIMFLQKLENNRRTAQVSSLSITPSAEIPDHVSFNLTLTLYIKP